MKKLKLGLLSKVVMIFNTIVDLAGYHKESRDQKIKFKLLSFAMVKCF